MAEIVYTISKEEVETITRDTTNKLHSFTDADSKSAVSDYMRRYIEVAQLVRENAREWNDTKTLPGKE